MAIYTDIDPSSVLVKRNEVEFLLNYAVKKELDELGVLKSTRGYKIVPANGSESTCNEEDDDDDDKNDDDDDQTKGDSDESSKQTSSSTDQQYPDRAFSISSSKTMVI